MLYIWILVLFIYAFECFPLKQHQNSSFDHIVAFGDSYTDDRSLNYIYERIYRTSGSNSDLSKISSDGPLWINYLQNLTGIPNLYNFARSGATVDNSITPRGTQDLLTQVDVYSKSEFRQLDNVIHFVSIGLNDIHDLFLRHENESHAVIDQIGSSVYGALTKLSNLGAKRLVLLNVIPLIKIPKFCNITADSRTLLDTMTKQYNTNLLSGMNKLNVSELHILHFDMYKKFAGFEKQKVGSPQSCSGGKYCDEFLWWDDLHPTTATHFNIAHSVYHALLSSDL